MFCFTIHVFAGTGKTTSTGKKIPENMAGNNSQRRASVFGKYHRARPQWERYPPCSVRSSAEHFRAPTNSQSDLPYYS